MKEDNKLKLLDVSWSKSGNYLILVFQNSFKIYGGEKLELVTQFIHQNVVGAFFSNNEKYLISYADFKKSSESLIVWDFFTMRKLRIFNLQSDLRENYQFSHDSKYVSGIKIQTNQDKKTETYLFVYELPNMRVLEDPATKERT